MVRVDKTEDIVVNSDAFELAYLKAVGQIKSISDWVAAQKKLYEEMGMKEEKP